MKKLLLSVAASAIGTTAFAGGINATPPQPPVIQPAPAYDWSGGYVGLQLGMLSGDLLLEGENLNNNNTTSAEFDVSGHEIGVYAGYNWNGASNMVYGVEAEYNLSDVDGDHPGVPGPSFGFIRNGIDGEITATGALRGRVGYAMDRTLFYGAAGLALANVTLDGTPSGPGDGPFNPSETLMGWTIGAGVERAISDTWTVRLDYRYSDMSTDFDFTSGGGDPHSFDLSAQTHQLRIGAAYRF